MLTPAEHDRLRGNLAVVRARIAAAAGRAGRTPDEVRLVAVTKYVGTDVIRALVALGVPDIGESRVQQLVERAQVCGPPVTDWPGDAPDPAAGPRWHMIGHLQRNKVKPLLGAARIVHSLDSERLAEALAQQAAAAGICVDVLIEVNVLLFAFNLFSTVLSKSNPHPYTFRQYLSAAFGFPLWRRLLRIRSNHPEPNYDDLPVFIVSVARGSIDTVINAVVLLSAGALLVIYGLPALLAGIRLSPTAVDALLYKNWFWWGLDMVADGNVLMYTAGVWYLLIPLLVGRKLFGESVVRTVILADLLVSMFVWSHHLLGDRAQPLVLRLLSGQFVTWGEFITMGLTIFAALMTIWLARPVKMTPALKFVLGSILGFILGGVAGLVQANTGLNLILHNTQWVIGIHAHTLLLIGLGMLLFAVIYALVPMLTKLEIRYARLVDVHLWTWLVGGLAMTFAMGFAGTQGMLRRTLYTTDLYQPAMAVAAAGALLMAVGYVAFLANIVLTLGWRNVVGLVVPERWSARRGTSSA